MWSVNDIRFRGPCKFGEDTLGFYRDIEPITEGIFKEPFQGGYINDLVGFLGYSTTFDITSLKEDKYLSTTRNLFPLYGMDQLKPLEEHTWQECNYVGTFQRWVQYTSNANGKYISGMIQIGRIIFENLAIIYYLILYHVIFVIL